jgi:hypothetical protein
LCASHFLLSTSYFQHFKMFCHIEHSLHVRKANQHYLLYLTENYGVD